MHTDGIARILIGSIVNFFILSAIFITTLIVRDKDIYKAFLYGIGLSLIAVSIYAACDYLSGGIATIIMFVVYPLVLIGSLIIYLISPTFLYDKINGISGYRIWSIIFWPIFILAMFISLILGMAVTYLSKKMSDIILNVISLVANDPTRLGVNSILKMFSL